MNDYIMNKDELEHHLMQLKRIDAPIVLFGTMSMGQIGKIAVEYLSKKVCCFSDNNRAKHGTFIQGIPVLSPENVKVNYPNAMIYICSFNKNNIKIIYKQLIDMGFNNIYGFSLLLWIYQIKITKRKISSLDFIKTMEVLYHKDNGLIFNSLGVIITEKCSLRCKYCIGLTPYIKDPKNYDKEIIIQSIKKLSDSVDAIESIGILGGETLLYPDLIDVCREAINLKNVRLVSILTNGTIIPSKEVLKCLKDLGIMVCISDYGNSSNKIRELEEQLIDYKIVYEILNQENLWYQCNLPQKHNRTHEENIKFFRECSAARTCPVIQNGKLFVCGYHGTIESLNLFSSSQNEHIDLFNNNVSIQEIREKIQYLFYNKDFIEACDYCQFCLKIPAPHGEQIE